jgi:hypothetical protein
MKFCYRWEGRTFLATETLRQKVACLIVLEGEKRSVGSTKFGALHFHSKSFYLRI